MRFTRADSYGNPATTGLIGETPVTTQYDASGQLVSLTDQENSTTTFSYNARGLVETKTDPFNRTTTFSYYDDGSIHTITDRKGDTTTYTYTPTAKVDTATYQDGSTIHFTYDVHDRMSSMIDSLGTTSYQRDVAGRVTSITDGNGNTVGYSYDDAGRLTGLTNFNGTVTTYSQDDTNRLVGLGSRTTDNSVIASFAYTLDANGNRIGIDKQTPLSSLLPMRSETADYIHNRLNTTTTATYIHDNEGQLSTRQEGGTTSYTFDDAYRLTGIADGTTTVYSYDGAGNRLKAVRNGVETRYIYDASGNVLAEADGNNNVTRYYLHGDGLLATVTPTDDVYCYHYDAIGSTVAITDVSENVVNSYAYTPFGIILNEVVTFPQPFKYVGQLGVMSEDNGLYYMRARYYDPEVGRFISEDPLGFDGGDVNLYVYGGNNPVLYSDPSGEFIFSGTAAAYFFVVAPVAARYGPVIARTAQSAYLQYAPAATKIISHLYNYELGPNGPSYYSRAFEILKEGYRQLTNNNSSPSQNTAPQNIQQTQVFSPQQQTSSVK